MNGNARLWLQIVLILLIALHSVVSLLLQYVR